MNASSPALAAHDRPLVLRALYRALVPDPVRGRIRARRREAVFARAFAQFRRDPIAGARNDALLRRLVHGWDNEGWSANVEYLRRVAQALIERPGSAVLECGSGLSTLVLGAVAARTGSRVYALEHTPTWRERVEQALARGGIVAATVVAAPIVDHGEFAWYQPSDAVLAERFALVVCDGPPGSTRGGRYGLLPVMRQSLADDCVVLLDDAGREAERTVLRRWAAEFGGTTHVPPNASSLKQFGEYVLGGAALGDAAPRDAAVTATARTRAPAPATARPPAP